MNEKSIEVDDSFYFNDATWKAIDQARSSERESIAKMIENLRDGHYDPETIAGIVRGTHAAIWKPGAKW